MWRPGGLECLLRHRALEHVSANAPDGSGKVNLFHWNMQFYFNGYCVRVAVAGNFVAEFYFQYRLLNFARFAFSIDIWCCVCVCVCIRRVARSIGTVQQKRRSKGVIFFYWSIEILRFIFSRFGHVGCPCLWSCLVLYGTIRYIIVFR